MYNEIRIAKTNLWINATAVSSKIKIIINGIDIIKNVSPNKEIDERRWINKWPLIIFAIRRTDKVIGRIKFLTVSIKTIKNLKKIGDPKGTRCDIIILVLFKIK